MTDSYAGLTPTEELVMEVLAARARTGETLWTFTSRAPITAAAKRLEDRGLVWVDTAPNAFHAGLTDAGKAACLDPGYITPNERNEPIRLREALVGAIDNILGIC